MGYTMMFNISKGYITIVENYNEPRESIVFTPKVYHTEIFDFSPSALDSYSYSSYGYNYGERYRELNENVKQFKKLK